MDIIEQLRKSGNKLLEAEAKDLETWGKLEHKKSDLEFFLDNNIAEIVFLTKEGKKSKVFGTANTTLVTIF